ncbi:peptidoglycan-associated lipoprotein [Shimia gijangensis]|uniref:Peptidoglycan-associated lipoprotein n=1 Tax=Shimia gijangensis TaxID=1470563 RepID=A0A1M6IFB1_9RHOB|nr:peptidoglycan-associated lipoprotein Pal [Shimia gijangensis]SHJ33157.1 peptidoglycan-associated lipoprotein [Shimia gijangensis]
MSSFSKVALLLAGLALGACSNSGIFDPDDASGSGTSGANYEAGSVDDPTSVAYFQQNVGDRVLFQVDQSVLTEEAKLVLLSQANWLLENSAYSAVIEGHADEQGTREYNLALGARRASAAKEFLVSRGIADNRLRTVSYGKERPLEVCSAEACYTKNRRAVTILQADLTG